MVFNWFKRKFSDSPADAPIEEQPSEANAEQEAVAAPEETPAAATPETDYLAWAKAAYQNIQQQQAQQQAEGAIAPAVESEVAQPEVAQPESVEPEAAQPEVAQPESVEPEVAQPEAAVEPEVAQPEVAQPESVEPEVAQPEAAVEPEVAQPESVEPEVAQPEAAQPESVETEAAVEPEVAQPESVEPEVAQPEAAVEPESVAPEAAQPESVEPEAAVEPEVTQPDTAQPETAEPVAIAPELTAPVEAIAEDAPAGEPLSFWARAEADRAARLERVQAEAIPSPEAAAPPTPTPPAPTPPELTFDRDFLWSAEVLAAQGRKPQDISIEEIDWLKRLRQGLDKSRRGLVNNLKGLFGQGPLNAEAAEDLEAILLQADAGVVATEQAIATLQTKLRQESLPPEEAIAYLKQILRDLLDRPWQAAGETAGGLLVPTKGELNLWLMVGVNGAGKTTTIGKLAHLATKSDYRCMIAAADTFRAAAVDQVKIWGQRAGVEVIANPAQNADPAAVVFDAITAAKARQTEVLLVDTAGRLQNKKNLMDELSKIRRTIDKQAPQAQVEALLVLDATLGQNGLQQARIFAEAAKLSGVVLTKLDGTAKGGIALAIAADLNLPIRFIGAGEGIEDLRPFSSYEFVEALLEG